MADFMIRFFICNVFISGIIGILLIAKRIFKNNLSGRMQYNLWFLLLGLLAVPFVPFRFIGFPQIFSWLGRLRSSPASNTGVPSEEAVSTNLTGNADWINDFTLSVNSETPSIAGYILSGIWIVGMLAMILFVMKSALRLHALKKSALPLQDQEVRRLYHHCLKEMGIQREIPVYSTAFLQSPFIVGLLKPCIYLPIHLISDYSESEMRYMLLHELQHYKHKDALASYQMNLTVVIYWFHPLVWYALKEMRNDREIACDTSVLKMLDEDTYADYGNTLINFAEKVSLTPFPFAAGLGGNMKQMKRRIINIASYEKPTFMKRLKGMTAFMLTAVLLLGFAPFISTYAADVSRYQWNSSAETISCIDLSAYFGEYDGSFVLYDMENDAWRIHDIEHATLRVAPNSTYKIYDALFGLEEGVITPDDSFMTWNKESYPFDAWNADQNLYSAMQSSVNWYFQEIDAQLGAAAIQNYLKKIGYGNENINSNLSSFWMQSSLKISPVEQLELLTKLQDNSFGFTPENIHAVKDAIRLSSSDAGTLYGKTGTGRIDGQDVNGWFVGFVETSDHTYFFATNIEADSGASGSKATEITMSILSDMNIWNNYACNIKYKSLHS
ncbi:MAG: BlaR1 family beta-lactam sensor/signal transducer [Lachnospiraceae bacterium]|nr:BlaR1 family beta-lactam sensor/signal transducer [Lachnospiraceae bacterium]